MKRFTGFWEEMCSLENIALAHRRAKKGKKHYREVQMVDAYPERYFREIRSMLTEKRYVVPPFEIMLKTDGPKVREIWKLPYFPDRIIHHCLVQVLEPVWMRSYIRDTYAALPGRGVHDGVKRLRMALSDVAGTRYCLKMDIRKFYQSITNDVAKAAVRRKVKDPDVLWLFDTIIESAPIVPIGLYTSQHLGNLVLSGFDHWVKEVLRLRYYFRYCDDLVFLGDDKAVLHDIRVRAAEYLQRELLLEVKKTWQVFPVDARGIDFLGYRFFHGYTLVRKRIVKSFKKRCRSGRQSSMAAYNGWFVWADTYNLRMKYGTRIQRRST